MSDKSTTKMNEAIEMVGSICCVKYPCIYSATKQIVFPDAYDVYCEECYVKEIKKLANGTYIKKTKLIPE